MTRRSPRTAQFGLLAAGAAALALVAGCGYDGSSAGTTGSTPTTQRAAAAAPTTCPEQTYGDESITFVNALDATVTLANSITCRHWSGSANPSAVNGKPIDAGSSVERVPMRLDADCATWGMTVTTGGTALGPIGVRLCGGTVGEDGKIYSGSLNILADAQWTRSGTVGTVTDASGRTRTVVASGSGSQSDVFQLTIAYGN